MNFDIKYYAVSLDNGQFGIGMSYDDKDYTYDLQYKVPRDKIELCKYRFYYDTLDEAIAEVDMLNNPEPEIKILDILYPVD